MKKVLVTGATGFLGKYVVEELVDHGYQVRAFGRNHTIGQSLVNASVTFVQGDLTNQEDLTKACQENGYGHSCRCFVNCLGSLGRFLPNECLRN